MCQFSFSFIPIFIASPELAGLLRRLKTIYAITGGKVEQGAAGKADFNSKKSILITQLHEFDNVRINKKFWFFDKPTKFLKQNMVYSCVITQYF